MPHIKTELSCTTQPQICIIKEDKNKKDKSKKVVSLFRNNAM